MHERRPTCDVEICGRFRGRPESVGGAAVVPSGVLLGRGVEGQRPVGEDGRLAGINLVERLEQDAVMEPLVGDVRWEAFRLAREANLAALEGCHIPRRYHYVRVP